MAAPMFPTSTEEYRARVQQLEASVVSMTKEIDVLKAFTMPAPLFPPASMPTAIPLPMPSFPIAPFPMPPGINGKMIASFPGTSLPILPVGTFPGAPFSASSEIADPLGRSPSVFLPSFTGDWKTQESGEVVKDLQVRGITAIWTQDSSSYKITYHFFTREDEATREIGVFQVVTGAKDIALFPKVYHTKYRRIFTPEWGTNQENTLLLVVSDHKAIYIGDKIVVFNTTQPIVRFVPGAIEQNQAFAVDADGTAYLLETVYDGEMEIRRGDFQEEDDRNPYSDDYETVEGEEEKIVVHTVFDQ